MQCDLPEDRRLKQLKEMIAAVLRSGSKKRIGHTTPELKAEIVAAWRASKKE